MQITDVLSPSDILLDVRAPDKAALLRLVALRAAAAVGLDGEALFESLRRREALGSTGMGGGIAIPHARLPELRAPHGLLARLRTPIPFEAVDDLPVDIVVLLLLPDNRQAEPLNALACVARRLRDPDIAKAVRRASKAADLYSILVGAPELAALPPSS